MRLLQFGYFDDIVNLLINNPSEEQIADIKRFYSIRDYLKLSFDVVVSDVIHNIGSLRTFEQWREDEMLQWYLDMEEYEGERLEVVKRLLLY